jgi:pimeloyl-ACP methyl ester carboxylesterase
LVFLTELLKSNLQYARNLFRGNWSDDPAIFDHCTPDKPPILLVHGFLGTRGALFLLEQRLRSDGWVVFSVNLGALNVGDIRKSAYRIHLEIERIFDRARGRIEKIDIVGHSMGGLIGLQYAQAMGGHERVRKLVALGTPWRGSWYSVAGAASMGLVSPSTWQMIPGSDLLKQINERKAPLYLELTSVYGRYDRLCPPWTAHRTDGANYQVPLGHAGLTVSQDVYRIIARTLRRPHQPGRESGIEYVLNDLKERRFQRRSIRHSRD